MGAFVGALLVAVGLGSFGACGDGPRAGGMDGAGLGRQDNGANVTEDGPVQTTLGDFLVDVRTSRQILQVFDDPRLGHRVYVSHLVVTDDGRSLRLDFDYLEGTESFGVAERGVLLLMDQGQRHIGQDGTVTVTPLDNGRVRIDITDLTVRAFYEDSPLQTDGPVRTIGDGVIEGPLERVCAEEGEVMHLVGAEEAPAEADPAAQQAYVTLRQRFCGENEQP